MSVGVELRLNGDLALKDEPGPIFDCGDMPIIGCLPEGMESGRPSVFIACRLPEGRGTAVVQTSVLAFLVAARAIAAKFPDGQDAP